MRRRAVLSGIAAGGTIGLAGCLNQGGGDEGGDDSSSESSSSDGSSSSGETDTTNTQVETEESLTFASSFQAGTLENVAIQRLKERVESETNGRIAIEHVPGGAYGGEVEMTQTLSSGGLGGMGAGPIPIFMYANEYWWTSSPYVLSSYDQFARIMESDLIQENVYTPIAENNNMRALGRPFYVGKRNITTNQAVRTPEDAQGLKIRVPGLDSWVDTWEEIGVQPTSVAGDEIYSALQTGTAAGAAVDANLAQSTKLHEVQSHVCLTEQMVGNRNLWINESRFQSLDQSDQDLLLEIGQEVTVEVAELGQEREEETINELEDEGMTIVRDVDVEAFRDAAAPAIERLFENDWALTWEEVKNM